jgi:hypothetical protein
LVSLPLLTKHLRIRIEKKKAKPSNKSNNEHKNTLSQVPNGIELIWRLGEDSIYLMCLGVRSFALVLNEMFEMLGCQMLWWLGRLLAMGAPDSLVPHRTCTVPCPVCRHITQPLGFGAESTVGGFVLLRHRTVRCHTRQSGAP